MIMIDNCNRLEEILNSKKNIQAIILGVLHEYNAEGCKEYSCYKKIIENIKPDFILVENSNIIHHMILKIKPDCVIINNNKFFNNNSQIWLVPLQDSISGTEIILHKEDFSVKMILLENLDPNEEQPSNSMREELICGKICEYVKKSPRKSIIVLIGHVHGYNIRNKIKTINYITFCRNENEIYYIFEEIKMFKNCI